MIFLLCPKKLALSLLVINHEHCLSIAKRSQLPGNGHTPGGSLVQYLMTFSGFSLTRLGDVYTVHLAQHYPWIPLVLAQ